MHNRDLKSNIDLEHDEKISCDLKFICSEKATKFCEIFPLLLTVCTVVKSKGKISQNFVAFSEYMNFTISQSIINNKAIVYVEVMYLK